MGIVFDIVTAPALGAPRGVHWLVEKLVEAAEAEIMDEGKIRGELAELGVRLDAGEIDQAEYEAAEGVLLARLDYINQMKEQREG